MARQKPRSWYFDDRRRANGFDEDELKDMYVLRVAHFAELVVLLVGYGKRVFSVLVEQLTSNYEFPKKFQVVATTILSLEQQSLARVLVVHPWIV